MVDTIVVYILILVKLTMTFSQGHRSPRKPKLLCQLSQSFLLIWWNMIYCGDILVWWILYSLLSCLFNIQGREPWLCDFVHKKKQQKTITHTNTKQNKKTVMLVYVQTFTDWFLSTWYGAIVTMLLIFMSVRMTLIFIQGQTCARNQKLWCPFSPKCNYQFGLK